MSIQHSTTNPLTNPPQQPVKTALKDKFSARFNAYLVDPTTGEKTAGWIFKKEHLNAVKEEFKCPVRGGKAPPKKPSEAVEGKPSKLPKPAKAPKAAAPVSAPAVDVFDRLRKAKRALDEGLIEESDYRLIKEQVMASASDPAADPAAPAAAPAVAPVVAAAPVVPQAMEREEEDDIPLSEKIRMAAAGGVGEKRSGEQAHIDSDDEPLVGFSA